MSINAEEALLVLIGSLKIRNKANKFNKNKDILPIHRRLESISMQYL